MDSLDIYLAQQKTQTRNSHIAIAAFFFVLFLLIILCVLLKHMFDQKEKKKSSDKFNVNEIIPDIEFHFQKRNEKR